MEIFAWCITTSHVHLVFRAEDYMYSSAINYAGEKGLLDGIIVVKQLQTTRKIRAVAGVSTSLLLVFCKS
jgi:REP element-mobilizing transposase RayT